MPRMYLSPIKENASPMVDAQHQIGDLKQASSRFDILAAGAYTGYCSVEHVNDDAHIMLHVSDFGLGALQETLIAIRRSVQTSGKLVIENADQYQTALLDAGFEKKAGEYWALSISSETCVWCNKRKGTETYTESALSYVHGEYEKVCEVCLLQKRIDFAEKAANELPDLRKRLAEIV